MGKTLLITTFLMLLGISVKGQSTDERSSHPERNPSRAISIYPNPAIEYVDVSLDDLEAGSVKLTLYNIIGNEMNTETEILEPHKIRVKVKELASGYYLIALRDKDTNFKGTYKFLKR